MRLVYILGLLTVLGLAALWSGWYGLIKRKMAAALAVICILTGGGLLLLAVMPGNSFYGPTVTCQPDAGQVVALTFDDGPYPPYTDELLEVLRERNVQATFFMIGEQAQKYPGLVAQIAGAGHEVALHAWRHRDFLKLTAAEQQQDLTTGKAVLEKLSGQQIRLMRPPHGFRDWSVMSSLQTEGLTAVNWSVIPRDWTEPGAEVIVSRTMEQIAPGAVILLHDGASPRYQASREQTVQAVRLLIDRLRGAGYNFVTVEELLHKGERK